MGKLRRRPCDGTQCRDPTFFHPQKAQSGGDPFFKPVTASAEAPTVQKEEKAPDTEEEKKNPLTEGLQITGSQLFKHEPFKVWFKNMYEPQLDMLKSEFWEKASPGEKAILLSFAGVNLGMAGMAFASSPELRATLSGVNIGAPLEWIKYSPIKGFKYTLPKPGETAYGFGAEFTFKPYLEAIRKRRPGFPVTGASFGLDSTYDPAGKGFNITGGKFGVDFLGGALKAEGKSFTSLSPYPMFIPGRDGMPGSTLMKEVPGMDNLKTGRGFQFMLNADFMKMPWFRRLLEGKSR